jgi:flagellar biosynthetic protein FlhB
MSDSGSEPTEEPTARRLQRARDDGQVARSTELPAAAVMIAAVLTILMVGGVWASRLSGMLVTSFTFDRKTLDTPSLLPATFASQLLEALFLVLPVLAVTAVVAILASGVTGGYHFSWKSVAPKFSKLSPAEGLKRMIGSRAAVELLKSLAKFTLVAGVLWVLVERHMLELIQLGNMELQPALAAAGTLITHSALWLTLSLVLIALIDAPYQKWSYIKRLRMTKQEIKDEMKDMEGRPEVKQQIRRRQREMANSRMMQKVKDADVVITNPEHFAIALSYDPMADGAPILLAKGADHMAALIREEAKKHGVEMFASPQLARALYFTTDVDKPIPEALYHAVAPVIAYVFSLAQVRPGVEPMAKPQPKVPPSMRFNAKGELENPVERKA